MIIDVQDPLRNYLLNACFYAVVLCAVIAVVPWQAFGVERLSRVLRWLVVPVLGIAIAYELLMPSRFDIRLDLVVLVPAYGVVIFASVIRWVAWRRIVSSRRGS